MSETRIKMGAGWRVAEVTVGAGTLGTTKTVEFLFGMTTDTEGSIDKGTGLVVYVEEDTTTNLSEVRLAFVVDGLPKTPWVSESVTGVSVDDIENLELKIDISVEGTADLYVEGTKILSGLIPSYGPFTVPDIPNDPDLEYPPTADGGYFGGLGVGYGTDQQRIFSVKFYNNVVGLPGHFDYSYSVPDDFVKFYEVGADNTPVERHGPCFMSNDDELTLRYFADITDVTKFPPHFEAALVAKLRSDLAIPLGGRNAKKAEWYQLYKEELERALSIEGFEESPNQNTFGVKTDNDGWVTTARYN